MIAKYERIRTMIQNQGLEGAIISSPEHFHYVTGLAASQLTVSRQPGYAQAILSSEEGSPLHAMTMDYEYPTFARKNLDFILKPYTTWVGVRQWEELRDGLDAPAAGPMKNSMDTLAESAEELGLLEGTIGLELDYLPLTYYEQLVERFPKMKFKNISPLFTLAKSVKTEEEIAMFRKLCAVADEGFYQVSRIAAVGVSEKQLSQTFRESVVKSGICLPSTWSMFSCGPASARLALPEDGVIKEGDIVKFDAGVNAEMDFYTTDTSRGWIVGKADAKLHQLKQTLYEAQRKMIEVAKPGLLVKELFLTGYEYVHDRYPSYRRGHLGHSISMGPTTHEAPYINATEERPLEAGMILAVEVPCYIDKLGGFNIEDMVLITDSGAEILTPKTPHFLPDEIRV